MPFLGKPVVTSKPPSYVTVSVVVIEILMCLLSSLSLFLPSVLCIINFHYILNAGKATLV